MTTSTLPYGPETHLHIETYPNGTVGSSVTCALCGGRWLGVIDAWQEAIEHVRVNHADVLAAGEPDAPAGSQDGWTFRVSFTAPADGATLAQVDFHALTVDELHSRVGDWIQQHATYAQVSYSYRHIVEDDNVNYQPWTGNARALERLLLDRIERAVESAEKHGRAPYLNDADVQQAAALLLHGDLHRIGRLLQVIAGYLRMYATSGAAREDEGDDEDGEDDE